MQNQILRTSEISIPNFLGAIFLVAGTCVGGGILALPLLTGLSGFLPSTLVLIIAWLFMMATGLLFLEVNLWLGAGSHVISMSKRFFCPIGKYISILLYIFICYSSLVAYISGGAALVMSAYSGTSTILTKPLACTIFGLLFGFIIFLETNFVGRVNILLVTGMIVSYIL